MSCLSQNLLYHFFTYSYLIGFGHILNTYDTQKHLNFINLLKTCYLQICKRFLAHQNKCM